jgi:hypothetical protein
MQSPIHSRLLPWFCLCLLLAGRGLGSGASSELVEGARPELVEGARKAGRVDFDRDIRPLLSDHCYACHGPDKDKRKAGLRLDVKADALRPLESGGFALVPGHPEQSRLLKLISLPLDDEDHMPPRRFGKPLNPAQITLLRRWIEQGAPWAEHWSYVPPRRSEVPAVRKRRWPHHEVDRFVLARLEQERLEPNAEADRYTLVRRLSLDLTGLPPSLAEVDEFVRDKSPDAYEKLVERLLASPHCGERLALAWLDQARYADTSGYHFDGFRQMHLWRDGVIQAFQRNQPFDQFTLEQLAGDLLPDSTLDQKIASGFHRNVMTNDEGGADPDEYMAKYVVDRVSTTAQVWLGTTLGCAECHDHKYDPISTKEFYEFYAFFHNVPEKGLDGTRVRNPAPVLKVPTPDQASRLLTYLDMIPVAEKTLADRENELPKAQEKWEQGLKKDEVLPPTLPGLLLSCSFDETWQAERAGPAFASNAFPARAETLILSGTNRAWAKGKIGQALRFSETNDVLALVPALTYDSTNAFSYGAWIKLEGKTGAVFSQMEDSTTFRGLDLLFNDGKLEAHLVHQFPDDAIKVVTRDALPTNVWKHVFLTYDGSRKAAGVKIHVDGLSVPTTTSNDKLSGSLRTSVPLLIGARTNAFAFRGLIDDLRFYGRALPSAEVADLAAYPNLLLALVPARERTEEQAAELKTFFREQRAPEFRAARERLAQLRKEKEELQGKVPDTMVMEELEKPRDTFILVRGNFQQKGAKVTPNTPGCWPPLPKEQPANRLTLARWLVSTNQPLTARVIVNRYWAMLFGIGLVKTGNDFGSQGDRPSHPELLDWLASEFMSPQVRLPRETSVQNWDVKHLLRLLVTSAAYRQSALVTEEKLRRDPYNRWLARGPRIRLDAELIRDNALAISGLLNRQIGGPSVKPYQPPGIWDVTDHKYEQSKGADLYRRGLYVFWKRAAPYPSFQTFDAPSRETCTLSRPRTSTPLQSLVIMNDPVYVEAARALAARVLQEGGPGLERQLAYAFRLTLARPPEKAELKVLQQTYQEQRANFTKHDKDADALLAIGESSRPKDLPPADLAAFTAVANVLLNLNETITK